MFYDDFLSLCVKNNQAPSYVIKNLGMSVGVLQKWKSGALPYDTTIVKIANYFGVPVAVLKGEYEGAIDKVLVHANENNSIEDDGTSTVEIGDMKKELLCLYSKMSILQKARLLIAAQDILKTE